MAARSATKLLGGVIMPNIKSAKKRVEVSKVNAARNKAFRSDLKTAIKKADAAIAANAPEAGEAVKAAVVKIDRAARKGLLNKNNAAHKKSALASKLNAN